MILIGSRALMLRAPNLLLRKPEDFDFICTMPEFAKWYGENSDRLNIKKYYSETGLHFNKMIIEGDSNCEFEIIQSHKSSGLLNKIVLNSPDTIETSFGLIPNLDLLFTIKSSHRYLRNSPYFWKTMLDYQILKHAGAKVRPEYQEFLKLREKETYTYKHPKLDQNKDGFFR